MSDLTDTGHIFVRLTPYLPMSERNSVNVTMNMMVVILGTIPSGFWGSSLRWGS